MRHSWATVAVASLASFQVAMTLTVVFVVFADLDDYFPAATDADLSWAINAFTIIGASTVVLGAAIADRYGHKRIALTGATLFTLGSTIAGTAPSIAILIVGRCVQALGASLFGPAVLALVLVAFPLERRGTALGVFTMGGALAAATGPALGGLVVEELGWRWAFLMVVPVGLTAVAAGMRIFPDDTETTTTRLPDAFGSMLILTGVGALTLALVQSDSWGWADPRTAGTAFAGLALLGWLLHRSRRHPAPVIDLSLYEVGTYRAGNFSFLLFALSFFSMLFAAVIFLTEVWDYELARAGLLTAPAFAATGLTGPIAGRLADAVGPRPVTVAGATLWTAAMATLALSVTATPAPGAWLTLIIVGGIGSGMFWGGAPTLSVIDLDADRFARASGINQTLQQVGNTLAIALTITLLSDEPTIDDFTPVFLLVVAMGAATATVVATAGRRTAM